MLEATKLKASIGASEVLKGIDVKVHAGELLTIIGANGAGKTSLLRALSNILPRSGGEVMFDGQPTSGLPAHVLARRGIVHVPQGRQIVPNLSVRANLEVGTHHLGLSRDEIHARMEAEFERFPVLRERQLIAGGALSGGEQQMLAVSRGLMMGPKVFMLDEPSLGLAPKVVQMILSTLRGLTERGLAVVLVEQVALLALEYADNAMVLRNGECVVSSSAASLRGSRVIVDSYLS
nr:branched-chain amino acid transport ATP-binding protein LivF [uncultured bacterium]